MNYKKTEDEFSKEISEFTMDGIHVPPNLIGGIVRYVLYGTGVGDFLAAVISNDLGKAMSHADESSLYAIRAVYGVFYNRTPSGCFGSKEAMIEWMLQGGRKGFEEQEGK